MLHTIYNLLFKNREHAYLLNFTHSNLCFMLGISSITKECYTALVISTNNNLYTTHINMDIREGQITFVMKICRIIRAHINPCLYTSFLIIYCGITQVLVLMRTWICFPGLFMVQLCKRNQHLEAAFH